VGLRFGTVNGLTPNTRIDLMLNSMIYNAITTDEVNVKNPKIARPILFIEDLKLAILKVLENPISGVYNLASTNITVEEVSKYVVDVTQARVVRLPDDSKPYNFHLDSSKFINTYGEYRYSRMERVVDELKNGIQQTNVGRRDILEPRQMRSLWLQ
jgi:nucleoside-diphosphate-sugar epimerase